MKKLKLIIFTRGLLSPAYNKLFLKLAAAEEIELQAIVIDVWKAPSRSLARRILKVYLRGGFAEVYFRFYRKLLNKTAEFRKFSDKICHPTPNPQLSYEQLATKTGVEVIVSPDIHSESTLKKLHSLAPDLGVICSGRILQKQLISIPACGILNIHKHKIPAYRGGGVAGYWEILNQEKEIGVTIHYAVSQVDSGNILAEKIIPITEFDTLESLKLKADILGAELYYKTIIEFAQSHNPGKSQNLNMGKEYRDPGEYAVNNLEIKLKDKQQKMPRFARRSIGVGSKLLSTIKYSASLPYLLKKRQHLLNTNNAPIIIFFYHTVGNGPVNHLTLPLEVFVKQIEFLQSHYEIISLGEAKQRLQKGENKKVAVVITFDDGYAADFATAVLYLKFYQVPTTYFVSAAQVLKQKPFLHDQKENFFMQPFTASQVVKLAKQGFSLGSHALMHERFSLLKAEDVRRVLSQSQQSINKITGGQTSCFSFPFGTLRDISPQANAEAEQVYQLCCHAWGGYNYAESNKKTLLRISAPDSVTELKRIMNGYTGLKEVLRGNAWGLRDGRVLRNFIQLDKGIRLAFIETGSGRGGSAYSLLRLLKTLSKQDNTVKAEVIGLNEKGVELFQKAGFPTRVISSKFPNRFFALRQIIKQQGYDLVHCNNPAYEHLAFILACHSLKIPCTLHFRVSRSLTRSEKLIMPLLKHCFAVSGSGVDILQKQAKLAEEKLSMLGDGVCLQDFLVTPEICRHLRKELNIADTDLVVLIAATLQPGKGQELCLTAATILEKQGLNVVWLLAGGEHYQFPGFRKSLQDKISSNSLTSQVRLLGHRDDMENLLAVSDLLALPSSLTEGTPCVIMEAFAAGKPVIASRIGGIPEAVDASVGRLIAIDSAEALAEAVTELKNREKRLALGENAIKRAKTCYDIEITAKQMLAVFRQLIAESMAR